MRKDPSEVTRELKLALIVGFALVLTVAILVSDHLSKARTANLATIGNSPKLFGKVPDSPIRSLDDLVTQLPAAVEVSAPVATVTEPTQFAAQAANQTPTTADPVQITPPVVIGQQQVPSARESKFGQGRSDSAGSLSTSIRDHADLTATTPTLGNSMPPHGATPQDIVVKEVKKAESAKPGTPNGEKSYTVANGDTLYAICRKQYGDANLYKKLAAANKMSETGGLKVGSTIVLPSKESLTGKPETAKSETKPETKAEAKVAAKTPVKVEPKALKVEESKNKSYQVRPGDTLSSIARQHLGSAARSNEIASLNRMDADDDLLAGAILKLPTR
ncbi:MAG: LysM peptidoglycan-binding domain-containing protein [Phycisphaerales bacterium]|nr:LysM peptidoglycan-binding domain-containing protein [Phycisphaerales bacterium]